MHQKSKGHTHFHGKGPLEHVIDARQKGKKASEEIHGAEMPGHISAFADACKETSLLLVLLWSILLIFQIPLDQMHWMFLIFAISWLIWKVGRSALLGWSRLERMHRLIEEERWEIEHHRQQEKEELRALYEAKGFSGALLDEVIDILMADDNRLLQVMLQEELGLKTETEEHPLKQALGAGIGVALSSLIMGICLFFLPPLATLISAALIIGITAGITAHLQKNRITSAIVWNLACAGLSLAIAKFSSQLFIAMDLF